MEASRTLFIIIIVFMLMQCIRCTKASYRTKSYKLFPEGFSVILQEKSNSAWKPLKLNSRLECAMLCTSKENCIIWSYDEGICQMFHSFKDEVTVVKSSIPKTYYVTHRDWQWIKMYSVKKGSGFKVAASFLGKGDYESWGPESCTKKFCPDLFRSVLIDVWKELPIKKIRLSVIKNNTEVQYIIFDGQGTTSSSWFLMSRVLEATWKDVYKGAAYKRLDLEVGERAFYMAQVENKCPGDIGWFTVTDLNEACQWGQYQTNPQILYSSKNVSTKWQTGHSLADALVIYVSF